MGLYQNANGGLYGHGSSKLGEMMNSIPSVSNAGSTQKQSGNGTVKVDVGGITISIQGSGNNVNEDIAQNADSIAGQIAAILEKSFQNMPLVLNS